MEKSNRYMTLSRKDVSDGIERKGQLDYLSWAYAWNALCEEYPDSEFYFDEPITFPDGSVMVKSVCHVDGKRHEMQLPVMDNRNKAIQNPNARDISDAQMRCLVKNIALYGLGISLYLGKLGHVVAESNYEKAEQFVSAQDYMGLHELMRSLPEQEQIDLWNGAPMGRKTQFKSDCRVLLNQAEQFLAEVASNIESAQQSDDDVLLAEVIGELSTYERKAVWGRLSAEQQEFVKQARSAA